MPSFLLLPMAAEQLAWGFARPCPSPGFPASSGSPPPTTHDRRLMPYAGAPSTMQITRLGHLPPQQNRMFLGPVSLVGITHITHHVDHCTGCPNGTEQLCAQQFEAHLGTFSVQWHCSEGSWHGFSQGQGLQCLGWVCSQGCAHGQCGWITPVGDDEGA